MIKIKKEFKTTVIIFAAFGILACGSEQAAVDQAAVATGTQTETPGVLRLQMMTERGDGQVGTITQTLPDRLVVKIADSTSGKPISGERIDFTVLQGFATLTQSKDQVTDAGGRAFVTVTFDKMPSVVKIMAHWLPDPDGAAERNIVFSVQSFYPPAGSIFMLSGGSECVAEGTSFSNPIRAIVRDTFGNPLPGQEVTQDVLLDGVPVFSANLTTDAAGIVEVAPFLAPGMSADVREAPVQVELRVASALTLSAATVFTESQDIFLVGDPTYTSGSKVVVQGPCGSVLSGVPIVFQGLCGDENGTWTSGPETVSSNAFGIAISNMIWGTHQYPNHVDFWDCTINATSSGAVSNTVTLQ